MNSIIEAPETYLGPIGKALVGIVILIIGIIVVKLICNLAEKLFSRIGFLRRTDSKGGTTDLVPPIVSLLKAILTILVLMAVLQYYGLTDVLAPLREMVEKFFGAIPNIIGAGIIGYAGWILAVLVADLVKLALAGVDEQIAKRTGDKDFKISSFCSAFIFGGVLLPISVAALGVLDIPAITNPASNMINSLLAAVPNIVGAGIILLVAYLATKFVNYVLLGLLDGMAIDKLPKKIGAEMLFTESFTPTKLIGGTIMFFAMLAATVAAVNTLGIDMITVIFGRLLEFSGGILIGAVILITGNALSSLAYRKLVDNGSQNTANIARIAILGLVLSMGLKAMGLADNIVNMAFGLTMGGVAVAFALAFGLGGRDAAKAVADAWAEKVKNSK